MLLGSRPWAASAGLSVACALATPAVRGAAAQAPAPAPARPATVLSPAARARADGGRPAYTAADVRFMSGMIGHHAQAVRMAGWAAERGAGRAVRVLSERILVSQRDEIAFMQRWLRERGEPVPDADAPHAMAHDAMHDTTRDAMPGMDHAAHAAPMPATSTPAVSTAGMSMPGMLTAAQLAQLEGARGGAFDRLFLTFMMQHHRGALTMVGQLFRTPGAGQDDTVFKFASDVEADQTTEIDRMGELLAALPPAG